MTRALKWLKEYDKGASLILTLGIVVVIMMLFAVVLEVQSIRAQYYGIETNMQRAVNSAVEYSMKDNYRSDRILILDQSEASYMVKQYLTSDLGLDASGVHTVDGKQQYKVEIDKIDVTASPPSITIEGYYYVNTIFKIYVPAGVVAVPFKITSENFRT